MITEEEVKAYQSIYQKVYQTEISLEDAREQGIKLIVFLEAIFKPSL
jgi:hypothetical protein